MHSNQLTFAGQGFKPRTEYGGGKEKGKRREARPFHRKVPLHLTMRANGWSLAVHPHARRIESLIRQRAKKYQVRIHNYANAGNHLHLLVQAHQKRDLQKFLRVVCGLIPRLVTGAHRGKALAKKFWDNLVYSRIVASFRDLLHVKRYIEINEMEAERVWSREWEKLERDQLKHRMALGP